MTNMALFAEQLVRADLARLLLAAVEASGRARCDIARDAQIHKDALRRVLAGERSASLGDLTKLGEVGRSTAIESEAVALLIRMSPNGELIDNATEVGLAALEASRNVIRNGRGSFAVEIEGTDVLIAAVDAVADLVAPDVEARRRRSQFEEALDAYRSRAHFFTRALSLLLGSKELMNYFRLDDEALAIAIAALLRSSGRPLEQSTAIQAWPAPGRYEPIVKFDVTSAELEQMLERDPGLRETIRMGNASAFLVRDLPRTAIQLGLIPSLLRRFVNFAETTGTPEQTILSSVGVELDNWIIGLG